MKKIFCSFFLVLFVIACNKSNAKHETDTYAYFNEELKREMKYPDIVNKFGTPDDDKGSGIHIYVYHLKDGTEIWIGYADSIQYARHMDADGQLLHTLI